MNPRQNTSSSEKPSPGLSIVGILRPLHFADQDLTSALKAISELPAATKNYLRRKQDLFTNRGVIRRVARQLPRDWTESQWWSGEYGKLLTKLVRDQAECKVPSLSVPESQLEARRHVLSSMSAAQQRLEDALGCFKDFPVRSKNTARRMDALLVVARSLRTRRFDLRLDWEEGCD